MEDLEDFSYKVTTESGSVFHIREVKPRDFYFAQILRQKKQGHLPLAVRLLLNPEVLDDTKSSETRAVFRWTVDNILDQNIFTVESWLEVSFHLCKQRWDATMDWLEGQPMSKIQTMIEIAKNFAEEQNKEAKKASRRKS